MLVERVMARKTCRHLTCFQSSHPRSSQPPTSRRTRNKPTSIMRSKVRSVTSKDMNVGSLLWTKFNELQACCTGTHWPRIWPRISTEDSNHLDPVPHPCGTWHQSHIISVPDSLGRRVNRSTHYKKYSVGNPDASRQCDGCLILAPDGATGCQ